MAGRGGVGDGVAFTVESTTMPPSLSPLSGSVEGGFPGPARQVRLLTREVAQLRRRGRSAMGLTRVNVGLDW